MIADSYHAAIDYVLSFADYERLSRSAVVFDLARVEVLLERLGQPHLKPRSVHVAGSKGKGSTAAMIASMLTASNYKTGLYTSPHLLSFTERFQIDGRPIAEQQLASLVEKLKPEVEAVNRLGSLGELTTFEILTAMAFTHFADAGVDFQVMETGLGGRLDATNVLKPEVCAITSISYDHAEILGDTLGKIAGEKAGIIKPGITVISAPQLPEASAAIEAACLEKDAPLWKVGRDIKWEPGEVTGSGQCLRITGMRSNYELQVPLLGEYQLENAAVAVGCLEVLAGLGFQLLPAAMRAGLLNIHWPGRLQVLRRRPLLVVDGAHNADSVEKLGKALNRYFDFDRILLIAGTSQEKDVSGIVRQLSDISPAVIATRSTNPRAATTARLCAEFSHYGIVPLVTESIPSAVDLALSMAGERDLICATGSLFLVAEVLEYLGPLSERLE